MFDCSARQQNAEALDASRDIECAVRATSVGLHAAVKPLLSHSTTGEFLNSPPKYLRTPKECPS
eukprot:5671266-Pyramimonas_sp.AAC.2